jgi:hypothetical protein
MEVRELYYNSRTMFVVISGWINVGTNVAVDIAKYKNVASGIVHMGFRGGFILSKYDTVSQYTGK